MDKAALQVRMSTGEYEAVKRAALSEGLSLSEFVRRRLFERLTNRPSIAQEATKIEPAGKTSGGDETVAACEDDPECRASVDSGVPSVSPVVASQARTFRQAPNCTNSRCARLGIPLCEECQEVNK